MTTQNSETTGRIKVEKTLIVLMLVAFGKWSNGENQVLCLMEAPGAGSPPPAGIIIRDFETEDFSGWVRQFARSYSGQIVTSPVRAGQYAARFELRSDDPEVFDGGMRSEVMPSSNDNYSGKFFDPVGSERWYGFSIFLPDDWVEDIAPEIVAQWHAQPDFNLGDNWQSPPLAIAVEEDVWKINIRWDSRQVTSGNSAEGEKTVWSESYPTGVWTD